LRVDLFLKLYFSFCSKFHEKSLQISMRPHNYNVTIAMITRLPPIAPMRFSIFRRLITSSKSLLSLGNRASRSFLARSTAAADGLVVLDGTHIDEFIKTRGIVTISTESVAEAASAEASVKRDACPLKCLLFLASGSPILVVLRLEDRVSESALATFLGIAKSRLEMARPQELIPLTGFPVGQVPPFGHREPLYTLIDQCVTSHSHVVFGDNLEYVLLTTELLRAANGKVVSVSLAAAAAAAATGNAEEGGDQIKATTLPAPWVSGAQAVSLTGIIAQKRKIANLLLFLSIVPPTSSSTRDSRPPPATSAYVRRVWAHPETSEPCEVQLILGKTLERRLGRAPAAELFKSLKRGQIVRVTGKPQEHQQQQGQAPRPYVVDMVVHDIEITGTIAPALYSRTGLVENDEEDEEHFGESEEEERERLKKEKKSQPFNKAEQALLDAELPYYKLPVVAENVKLVNDLASIGYMAEILLRGDHRQHSQTAEVASLGSGGGNAEDEEIEKKQDNTTVLPTSSSMPVLSVKHRVKAARRQAALDPGTWRPRLILGLDAEWQPNFSREEKNSPVSVLQIGSTAHVFLIDMLELCHNPREESSPHDRGKTKGKTTLTLEQKALSDVLEAVLGDAGIVKVGFGLKYDFKRLVESYPWMPCFAAAAAEENENENSSEEKEKEEGIAKSLPYRSVPIRSHVDALLLARSAGDGQTSYKRLGLSAVCRLILGKAVDKSEQTSDWGTRPLTQDQIYYAAADVTCLVDIFNGIIARRPDFLAAFWMAQFSSHLTDMAALRPKLSYSRRGRGGNEGAGGASGAGLSWRTNTNARGYGSTNQVQCNVDALMRYLGQPIPDGGKLSIIKLAASETVQTGSGVDGETRETILVEPSRVPRFTRGSGLLEFENRTYLLFVNVPSQKYPNVFSFSSEDDGEQSCYMTWWPGKGQTMAHPMIQRLLPAAAAAAAVEEKEQEQEEKEEAGGAPKATEGSAPTVILFVRPQRDEYSCFGRLKASAVEELDGQLCVSWKLVDYSGIKSSAPFQQVLTLQKT
jgi:prolyl-tRNA editing enzyme YbaK/EbsC (Cys-tRNA(Pro) deacylase)